MRIVVGIDGSTAAMAGARWMSHLPLGADDEVVLVAAAQRPVIHQTWGHIRAPATDKVSQRLWKQAEKVARDAVAKAASTIERLPCIVRTVVEEGHPIDVLSRIAVESEADLLVVGPRGKSRLARIRLGSVSHGLLESMPAPVLIARRTSAPPLRVLLATDGSPASMVAARYLSHMPLPAAARIHVMAVDDRSVLPPIDDEESWAARAVDSAVTALASAGRTSVPAIEYGFAPRKLMIAADQLESDLIVTGARGLGGFSGLVLGSVSRAVSTAARCSVLVVGGKACSTAGRTTSG